MAVTLEYLGALAPEFATITPERFAAILAVAGLFVQPNQYGDKTDIATAYLMAHILKLGDMEGSGAVTQEKIGDIQRSFASGQKDNYLALTSYGGMYEMITTQFSEFGVGIFVTGEGMPWLD